MALNQRIAAIGGGGGGRASERLVVFYQSERAVDMDWMDEVGPGRGRDG